MKQFLSLILVALWFASGSPAGADQNRALYLDGDGDFVDLPRGALSALDQATIEAWVRWEEYGLYSQWFTYGEEWLGMGINHNIADPTFKFFNYVDYRPKVAQVTTDLPRDRWCHMAAVSGPGGMKLYLNGMLVAEHPDANSFSTHGDSAHFALGRSPWAENLDFQGWLDEVRVWSVERTPSQIRAATIRPLVGDEEHLVGYWNFDDSSARDLSSSRFHGTFIGDAHVRSVDFPQGEAPSVLSGVVRGADGLGRSAVPVRFHPEDGDDLGTRSVEGGWYGIALFAAEAGDLSASLSDRGSWRPDLSLSPGTRQSVDLTMGPVAGIAGRVLNLDGRPRVRARVQLVPAHATGVADTLRNVWTDRSGEYRLANLRQGSYRVRTQRPGGWAYHGSGETGSVVEVDTGITSDIDIHSVPMKAGTWQSYPAPYHFAGASSPHRIMQSEDGRLWLPSRLGLSVFDGEVYERIDDGAGTFDAGVDAVIDRPDGVVWIGTPKGLVRHDPQLQSFRIYTTDDGLPDNSVGAIRANADGGLWLATAGGVALMDQGRITTFNDHIEGGFAFEPGADDSLWMLSTSGVWALTRTGLKRQRLPGFPHRFVFAFQQNADGSKWLGSRQGMWRFEAGRAHLYPEVRHAVYDIHTANSGTTWFSADVGIWAVTDSQVVLYDHLQDHISGGTHGMLEAEDGTLWFASEGGVMAHRPEALQVITEAHGLRSGVVHAIHPVEESDSASSGLWLGTDAGLEFWDGEKISPAAQTRRLRELVPGAVSSIWPGLQDTFFIVGRSGTFGFDGMTFPIPGQWNEQILALATEDDGTLWLAAQSGLFRHDGTNLEQVSDRSFRTVLSTSSGLWAGSTEGLFHWTGERVERVLATPEPVAVLAEAAGGGIWCGTAGAGLYLYRADGTAHYDHRDGLANDYVRAIEIRDGRLYAATDRGGVAIFDRQTWSSLDTQDGLPSNRILDLRFDGQGNLWIGTEKGLVRYLPDRHRPGVRIISQRTDAITQGAGPAQLEVGTRISIEFRAVEFSTPPEKRQYRYRVREVDAHWRVPTGDNRFDWSPEEPGEYTFEVQAIDRDLNYSEPASMRISAVLPWVQNAWIVVPLWTTMGLLLLTTVGLGVRTWRQHAQETRLREQLLQGEQEARLHLEQSNRDLVIARREAERANRAKSSFLANMSHEIRTPLNAILGFAQVLSGDRGLKPTQRQAVDTIHSSGDHLLALINDVLDLSKIEADRVELAPEDFDLHQLACGVASMFEMRCRQQGLSWRADLIDGPAWVRGDANKLRQVLINLLANATKFCTSGEVGMSLQQIDAGQYRFAISDTGPGIDAEQQAAIFEPFEQAGEVDGRGGTGLGLAIASRHVSLMGGQLQLTSRVGEGSTFYFVVPLQAAEPAVQSPGFSTDAASITGLTPGQHVQALVIDDVEANRQVLSQLLSALGVNVETGDSAEAGIDLVRSSKPDIVFMDIRLPGISGIQGMQRLIEEHGRQSMRFVAVSASVLSHERQEYLTAGFDAFIGKPFRRQDLCECLVDLLDVTLVHQNPVESLPDDLPAVALPEALYERLQEAVRWNSVTEIKEALDELAELSDDARRVAEHLRALTDRLDMAGIRTVLEHMA
ncbi:MAG: response regulator [Gemmatimonadetes bacterium]|nr:response regulator [Gemmatimonadota bacterium]MBT5144813.1 response regulator [Gemmatimonadota bacterium]MBT5587290.1 response regulator [Gemmatimonadota bacterium]MBT5960447.1 response regulator [Gemmatimonadota bacterium]MBT6630264.1 response regulator [Gemmatimonadota bacterium]